MFALRRIFVPIVKILDSLKERCMFGQPFLQSATLVSDKSYSLNSLSVCLINIWISNFLPRLLFYFIVPHHSDIDIMF